VVSITPRPRFTPGTHCTGGWLGPRAGLDTEVRGKILCPCRGSNPDRTVVQPVVRHYTYWANPAPPNTVHYETLRQVWNRLLIHFLMSVNHEPHLIAESVSLIENEIYVFGLSLAETTLIQSTHIFTACCLSKEQHVRWMISLRDTLVILPSCASRQALVSVAMDTGGEGDCNVMWRVWAADISVCWGGKLQEVLHTILGGLRIDASCLRQVLG
jgi:hypothetical protein